MPFENHSINKILIFIINPWFLDKIADKFEFTVKINSYDTYLHFLKYV